MDWNDEELIKAMRFQGEENLFFFIREVCEFGHNPDPNGPRITEDQKELCDWLQGFAQATDPKAYLAMVLAPRDTLKSTVLQGFVLWLIVKYPDVRILLYGEVHEQAQKRLAVIKRVISSCKTFRLCYGELCGSKSGLPWNENLFVSTLRKNTSIREGTVETAGLDVVVNSRHYDFIFPDDLHSEKNTKTKDQIEDVKEKFQLLLPLKSKGGKIVVAGVFWNDGDIHTWLKEEKNPVLFLRSAEDSKGMTTYPHALPQHELEIRKMDMRADLYSCHYLLDPVSADTLRFKKEYFVSVPRNSFRIIRNYLLIDPAGDPTAEQSAKRDSDFIGMVLFGVNELQDMILLDGFRGKVSPTEGIEEAMHLILRYKPFVIGIEKAAVGNMGFYLREEIRKRGIYALVHDCLPRGRSKYQRVMELEPLARRRKIFVADECPIKEDFLDEAARFPKAKHDDLIDPSAYILDIFKEYGTPTAEMSDQEEKIDPRLMELNPQSRDYWLSVKRSKIESDGMGEFC